MQYKNLGRYQLQPNQWLKKQKEKQLSPFVTYLNTVQIFDNIKK